MCYLHWIAAKIKELFRFRVRFLAMWILTVQPADGGSRGDERWSVERVVRVNTNCLVRQFSCSNKKKPFQWKANCPRSQVNKLQLVWGVPKWTSLNRFGGQSQRGSPSEQILTGPKWSHGEVSLHGQTEWQTDRTESIVFPQLGGRKKYMDRNMRSGK